MKKWNDGLVWTAVALGCLLASPVGAEIAADSRAELTREQRLQWWRDGRFGMFIHWGLYAIPAGKWGDTVKKAGYSEWIMYDAKIPVADYEKLAVKFNPVKFDADAWAALAKQAGMKYMVLTAKHHDGFSMFGSDATSYDIVDATPFGRDVTGELAAACRKSGLRFGCYYSVDRDWYRPQGPGNRYKQTNTWDYPESTRKDFDRYFTVLAKPQVEELLRTYRLDLLWFDGINMKTDAQVEQLYQSIRGLQPACVINSRIRHCVFPKTLPPPYCDYVSTGDNEIAKRNPGVEWENPGSMNTSFGYNRFDHRWKSARQIVINLADTVSKGGNYLLNVGPTAEGLIPGPSVDRLREVGAWMDVNGEAIYGTAPWRTFSEQATVSGGSQSPVELRFTSKGDSVYVICLDWTGGELAVRAFGGKALEDRRIQSVRMLGVEEAIAWHPSDDGLALSVPSAPPCQHAYVYRVDMVPDKQK